jgi:hypothetical protein
MADKNYLIEAVELRAGIIKNAEERAACWRSRNIDQAEILGGRLETDWQKYRIARAKAFGEHRLPVVDHPIDRFLNECCRIGPQVLTPVRDVHNAYVTWAADNDEDKITSMRLTQELKRRGIETTRTKTTRLYSGVAVTAFTQMPLASAA